MIGIGALSALFLPSSNPWIIKIIACIACIVFMTINLISVKHAGKFQIVLVIALLAIPHIIIPGENKFQILLVRCKEGVIFSELNEPVKTAFILLGSQDERNYHLRALMSIAHVVSEKDFEQRWTHAKNKEQLRDIILLSSRKRDK